MLWWVLMLFALAILSYLSTVGTLFTLEVRHPFLTSTFINILILACIAGAVVRILKKMKKREKENLTQRVKELEEELKALKEKNSNYIQAHIKEIRRAKSSGVFSCIYLS